MFVILAGGLRVGDHQASLPFPNSVVELSEEGMVPEGRQLDSAVVLPEDSLMDLQFLLGEVLDWSGRGIVLREASAS